jgi:FdhD protein
MLYCSESSRLDEGAEINIEIDDISAFISSPQAQALLPTAGAPRLSSVGGPLLRELQVLDEMGERRSVQVPVERPLQIIVNGRELVTLMTLGARPELLVLGYLRNQRIIERLGEIESIDADLSAGSAEVVLRSAATAFGMRPSGTACGLGTVFGDWMKPADALPSRPLHAPEWAPRISRSTLLRILDVTRQYDTVHRAAGSVHGCALFHGADLLVSVEDVSRHNGLDTVTGWMLLHGIEGGDKTWFTTGRLTGEMVMKAAHNGVSIMVSRNGVTSMGHALAMKLGMVLFGRAAKGRYLGYGGLERFDADA